VNIVAGEEGVAVRAGIGQYEDHHQYRCQHTHVWPLLTFLASAPGLQDSIQRGVGVGGRAGRVDRGTRGHPAGNKSVRQLAKETAAGGLRIKPPKSKAGRRDISLPATLVETLQAPAAALAGAAAVARPGPARDNDLVFPQPDGRPQSPNAFSAEWSRSGRRLS